MAFSVASSDDFELLDLEDSDQEELLALSHWEFIDVSDADSKSQSDEQDQQPPLVSDAPITPPTVTCPTREADTHRRRETRLVRVLDLTFQTRLNHHNDQDHDDDVDDDEDDDVEDGYGLDDELVPWSVSDKLGRERMRKLGKKTFAKMLNSKRSPYLVVKPGYVRGKHGLGLKHIY